MSIEFAVELRTMLVVCRYVCFEISQTFIWRSFDAVTIPWHPIKNLTHVIWLVWPTSWWTIRWVLMSHTRQVLSFPPPATRVFVTSQETIELLLPPLNVASIEPSVAFQIFTVPSKFPPVANNFVPAVLHLRGFLWKYRSTDLRSIWSPISYN